MMADSRESIMKQYSGMVWNYAHKYANVFTTAEDLYTEGICGLLNAQDNYKPDMGIFCTYAHRRVSGSMIDYLRTNGSVIHAPRHADNIDLMHIDDCLEMSCSFDMATTVTDKVIIDMATSVLSYREKLIIDEQYFKGYSQAEISKRTGISAPSVSLIRKRAIKKMREAIS
jgi:RNA polymerase sigma factor (sigma-70 family)